MPSPNIVFICTDQQRFDSLSCCGHPIVQTPNLDRLAAGGVRLTRHVTPNQICAPARASMFTGLYPRAHGLCHNGICLDPNIPTLPGLLANAGYRTHGIGKFHLQPYEAPADQHLPESVAFWQSAEADAWRGPFYGFESVELVIDHGDRACRAGHYGKWLSENHPDAVDLYNAAAAIDPSPDDFNEAWKSAVPEALHYNSWIADRAVDFLDEVDDPFFLYVSFPDPHHPYTPPQPYCDRYDPAQVVMPRVDCGELDRMPPYCSQPSHPDEQGAMLQTNAISESTLRRIIAHTYGMVEMIDVCAGRVMAALETRGLADNTIIIFTSDHGELLGDHGLLRKGPPPYRQIIQVPMLVKGPGVTDSSGGDPGDNPGGGYRQVDGMTSHLDIMPTLLEWVGIDVPDVQMDGRSFMPLITGKVQEIRTATFAEYHPRAAVDLYNQTIRTDRWRMTLYPMHPDWGELFDLSSDPCEHENRFADPGLANVVAKLRQTLTSQFPSKPQVTSQVLSRF